MSFLSTLTIDDTDYKVLKCHFGMNQSIAKNGMAIQNPTGGGLIDIIIESTSSTDLFDWMVSANKKKNGSITFYRRDAMSRLKRLDFTDALCVRYDEDFDHDGASPMTTRVTISAREIVLEDVTVSNNWTVM